MLSIFFTWSIFQSASNGGISASAETSLVHDNIENDDSIAASNNRRTDLNDENRHFDPR